MRGWLDQITIATTPFGIEEIHQVVGTEWCRYRICCEMYRNTRKMYFTPVLDMPDIRVLVC
ncbi:hypothetical protein BC937DRAFT_90590 [Endogone sp. FLAS-F59071]|nr:hypothetical protein BC937DRAFT_90590 [Endogone sp. FLAS-F59071]|eukprot:RUS22038.1 hypothetical protein BC937DRAFT_90590 [Endogone sp. FLAS-F59071]